MEDERVYLAPFRGSKTNMTTGSGKNTVLFKGEIFVEYPDSGQGTGKCKIKIGDGVSAYSDVPYAIGDTSTDPITFTQGSQTTAAAALAAITTGSELDDIVGNMKQAVHLCDESITTINSVTIPEMRANFQAGVNSIYDAVVAKGVTPASKSLSDVVAGINAIETKTIHTRTYTANNRASNLDMGAEHEYRYVDTRNVPNSNSGTYTPTTRVASIDMGANNSYRYVTTTSVPNSNSATYQTITANSSKIDMGETNNYRYLVVSVPNSNSATYPTITANNNKIDMGATNNYRYLVVNVPNSNSATYPTITNNSSKIDLGATNNYRYLVVSVPASAVVSGTYTYPSGSTGDTVDITNYKNVNASNVYSKGVSDGQSQVVTGTIPFFVHCAAGENDGVNLYIYNNTGKTMRVSGWRDMSGDNRSFTVNGSEFPDGRSSYMDLPSGSNAHIYQNSRSTSNPDHGEVSVCIVGTYNNVQDTREYPDYSRTGNITFS